MSFTFDPTRDDLKARFRELCPEGRLQKARLKEFLTIYYQAPIAELITNFLKSYYNDFISSINILDFYKGIQDLVNKDHKEWQRLRFCIYDVLNEGKLTDRSLFQFIKDASIKPVGYVEDTTVLLGLNEFETDIFLEIFANDYGKIIKMLANKRIKTKIPTRHISNLSNKFVRKSNLMFAESPTKV